MPGVYAFGTFDTWSPGYLMFIAATHNGISRLYETFGNSGSADTLDRTLSAGRNVAHMVPAESAAAVREVVAPQQQQLRDDGTAGLAESHREQPRLLPPQFLRQEQALDHQGAYRRAGRLRAAGERSAAGRQAELLRVLQKQRVEVSRATAAFTVQVPVRPARHAGGRDRTRRRRRARRARHRHAHAAGAACAASSAYREPRVPGRQLHHPHGSAVLAHRRCPARLSGTGRRTIPSRTRTTTRAGRSRRALPFRRCACSIRRSSTCRCSSRQGPWRPPSGVAGTGSVFAINNNADNGLISLRYRLRSADIQMAEEPFEAGGVKFTRGSFIIRNVSAG